MEEVIKLNSVDQYNKMYGLETLHPLVTVVDLSKATVFPTHFTLNYGLYALFLKQTKCGDLRYGRQMYDYQEGTVTSFAPGQVVEVKLNDGVRPMSHGILFHPDLIRGTSLGQEIKHYSFFSYASNEAPNEKLPTVKYFADKVNLSSNYFGDLIKKETGKTAQEYIQGKIINIAKERILASEKTVSEIAYELGFQYPQHFTRIFKKVVGCTPTEYRVIQV